MADSRQAVFLSYASQDAEAARRICDALRAAGVEVWFDQSELRGGDAWDAKIRKQIKECALFVPIISANTQARLEGYFRLEWKLAEDRSHLMAKGKPFIVPVTIGEITDRNAYVPDSFLAVQWTRVPAGEATQAFCNHVRELLAGVLSTEARLPVVRRSESGASRPAAAEKSIAVLAFANLSRDAENEYFSDGISEELLDALGKVPGLRVAGRTSSFSFKGKNVPETEIARQLGVTHIVSGSVQRTGSQIRIVARLVGAEDGFQLWSDKFTREAKDIFALQDEITRVIAQALQLKLGASRAARPVNPEAHGLVLEGRHFWNMRGTENLARAEAAFLRALQLDAGFAQALAGLADVYAIRAWYLQMEDRASEAERDLARARQKVGEAMALDDSLPEPHASLGAVAYLERAFEESERAFAGAFQRNPNYAVARHWHSVVQGMLGKLDAALEHSRASALTDPRSPNHLWSLGTIYYYLRRHEEALAATKRSLALRPGFLPALAEKAVTSWYLGRNEDAVAAAQAIANDPTSVVRWWADADAIFVLRLAGREAEAKAVADRLFATTPPTGYRRGFALAALGRLPEACAGMTKVPTTAWGRIFYHHMWDPARDDPRFLQMIERLGCVEQYKLARTNFEQLTGVAKE